MIAGLDVDHTGTHFEDDPRAFVPEDARCSRRDGAVLGRDGAERRLHLAGHQL